LSDNWTWGLSLIALTIAIHIAGVTFLVSALHGLQVRLESPSRGLPRLIAIVVVAFTAMGLLLAVLHGERRGELSGDAAKPLLDVHLRALAMPKTAEPWSLTSLREKLIKIGAKVTSHGRYVTFQTAEVAVPRQMFAEILSLIAWLRAPAAPE
jgi:hypothetical protein